MELTAIDMKILKYINDAHPHIEDINKRFKMDCNARIDLLIASNYVAYKTAGGKTFNGPILYGIINETTGEFLATETGRMILQNYKIQRSNLRKKLTIEWLRYIITTLIAVTALVNSILARLGV